MTRFVLVGHCVPGGVTSGHVTGYNTQQGFPIPFPCWRQSGATWRGGTGRDLSPVPPIFTLENDMKQSTQEKSNE